jgi:hypothetical protein
MKLHLSIFAVMMLLCLPSCGVNLGPQTKTEWIIAHPGKPGKVLENKKVTVKPEGASQPIQQDIGGWEVMPRDHFDALMRAADGAKPKVPKPPTPPNKESGGVSKEDMESPDDTPILRDGEEILWPPQLKSKPLSF